MPFVVKSATVNMNILLNTTAVENASALVPLDGRGKDAQRRLLLLALTTVASMEHVT